MKLASVLAFATMVVAVAALLNAHLLFAHSPQAIAFQVGAVLLMIWARLTFGLRSLHAAANPTGEGLIATGPYRFLRHPIYASICLFVWAGILDHLSLLSISLGALATASAIVRMICEEYFLLQRYSDYPRYMRETKRLLPGLW
jgi:protein-S-isoprenylcysteine O-methyltransferase Ste14